MRPEEHADVADRDLSDSIVLVTGATDGMGREAALAFGRLGATVVVVGRTPEKGRAVVDRFASYEADAHRYTADFSTMAAVEDLAADVRADFDRIDVLVNNAGGIFREETVTPEGFEKTAAVNYLAAYRLTHALRDPLRESDDPRVVNVSSNGHRFADMDVDALEHPDDYGAFDAYNRSKLALLCFSNELARRSDRIRSNALHPGFVPGSGFYRRFPGVFNRLLPLLHYVPRVLIRRPIVSTAEAGGAILHAALRGETGEYYEENEPVQPSEEAQDPDVCERLWTFTADRLGVDPNWP